MKLIWKGKFENEQQLSTEKLPCNAVKFKEPGTPAMVSLVSSLFIIPVLIIILGVVYIKTQLGASINFSNIFNIWGILLAFLFIIPHEFLHAIAFPRHVEVQVWYSPKNIMVFVFSTFPISKLRFIYLNLLPNIIFGIIPLIIFIFIPIKFYRISEILLTFATFSLTIGIGDFLNAYNAATQMPKDSMTQLSGFHSYWYLP
jgi:hypothetical protein